MSKKSKQIIEIMKERIIHFNELWILIALIVICVILSFASPQFLSISNFFIIARQVSIIAVVAIGGTFAIISKGLDLSVGSMVALLGVIMASLIQNGFPVFTALFIGLVVAGILGTIHGIIITRLNISPFLTTLAGMLIYRGFAIVLTGGRSIFNLPDSVKYIGSSYWGPIPIPVVIVLFLYIVFYLILTRSKYGRYIRAIGCNETAAYQTGINVKSIVTMTYIIAGLLTGVGAIILFSRLGVGQPNAGLGLEFQVIPAIILGGTSLAGGEGTLIGTLIGALIIGVISNGLNLLRVPSFFHDIATGAIILIAVLIDSIRVRKLLR